MPTDSPGSVALFVDWLYTKEVPISNVKSRLLDLYDLYFLATKLMLVELMDKTLDAIQNMSYQLELFIDLQLLVKVYENTPEGSQLRKFGVEWHLYTKTWEKYHQRFPLNNRGRRISQLKSLEVRATERITSSAIFQLTREESRELWEASKDYPDLFQDHLELSQLFQDPRKVIFMNPAWRVVEWEENYEGDEERGDYCLFHSHEEDFDCRPKKFLCNVADLVDDVTPTTSQL